MSVGELARLPQLSFVLAEVLHDERPHVGDAEEPLARGEDGEAPQIADDPATIQLLGHRRRRAGAAETVEDEVGFVGRGFEDAFEKGFRFLSRVTRPFDGDHIDRINVSPNILRRHPFHFI